jgi:hypothetical protein
MKKLKLLTRFWLIKRKNLLRFLTFTRQNIYASRHTRTRTEPGIIELHASRYDKTEGKQVVDITPEGTLDIKAVNVKAIRGLVKGKEYYINIVEA